AEVPSSFTGIIKEIIAQEGETITVGEIICTIETEENSTEVEQMEVTDLQENSDTSEKEIRTPQKQRYSPAVLRLSQEHDIDLSKITGTGRGGRITRKDVLNYIANNKSTDIEQETTTHQENSIQQLSQVNEKDSLAKQKTKSEPLHNPTSGDIEIPVSGIRRAIATNMKKSKQEIPHAWMMVEVDVTNLVQYRDSIKNEFLQKEGFKLTYFPFFVKAVAQALKEFPQLNSMWAG